MSTIQNYLRPLYTLMDDHRIPRRCLWEICKGAIAGSPITDLTESFNRATEELTKKRITPYIIIVFAGTSLMTHATISIATKIFNKIVFHEDANSQTTLAADLLSSISWLLFGWGVAICHKTMTRGLKHY